MVAGPPQLGYFYRVLREVDPWRAAGPRLGAGRRIAFPPSRKRPDQPWVRLRGLWSFNLSQVRKKTNRPRFAGRTSAAMTITTSTRRPCTAMTQLGLAGEARVLHDPLEHGDTDGFVSGRTGAQRTGQTGLTGTRRGESASRFFSRQLRSTRGDVEDQGRAARTCTTLTGGSA